MTTNSLTYGTTIIHYTIQYADRKTLRITVHSDGLVIVQAPIDTSKEVIKEKVNKRASWILKQQTFFNPFGNKMPQRRYINGLSLTAALQQSYQQVKKRLLSKSCHCFFY